MTKISPKIRIKDIAKLAGVSEGTVDRVLHERGDVSSKSREAVNAVLEEMNYSPNLLARSLASKKRYAFACIFPSFQEFDYWEMVNKGFEQAAQEFANYNVSIKKFLFNQYDTNSFVSVSEDVIEGVFDAVIIAPVFKNESQLLCRELMRLQIPFSFIDSMIKEEKFLTYYGQDSFQSGYIAAKLVLPTLLKNEQVIVIRTHRKGVYSNQTILRHDGFMHYMDEHQLSSVVKLKDLEMSDDDDDKNKVLVENALNENTNVKAIITFNSKVYRLASYLETINRTDIRLLGYDLLAQNVHYLKCGIISYLIAQRPEKQAYLSIRDLCKVFIFRQDVQPINFVPIDILLKENIDSYIDFRE